MDSFERVTWPFGFAAAVASLRTNPSRCQIRTSYTQSGVCYPEGVVCVVLPSHQLVRPQPSADRAASRQSYLATEPARPQLCPCRAVAIPARLLAECLS